MDWSALSTAVGPWALGLVVGACALFAIAFVIGLIGKRFKIKEIEFPFFGLFKFKAEPAEPPATSTPEPARPQQTRTIQKGKATGGADVDMEQAAPAGVPASQTGEGDGEHTRLKMRQHIH